MLYSVGRVYTVYTVFVACIFYNVGGGYTSNVCAYNVGGALCWEIQCIMLTVFIKRCIKAIFINFCNKFLRPNFFWLHKIIWPDKLRANETKSTRSSIAIAIAQFRFQYAVLRTCIELRGPTMTSSGAAFVNIINMITSQSLASTCDDLDPDILIVKDHNFVFVRDHKMFSNARMYCHECSLNPMEFELRRSKCI
jgi:hypothetical protein